VALALVAAMGSFWITISAALFEIVVVTIAVVAGLPWIVPWLFDKIGKRPSEPEI
jgi:hypothetical protein